jgi:hypothetical protein
MRHLRDFLHRGMTRVPQPGGPQCYLKGPCGARNFFWATGLKKLATAAELS